MRMKVYYSFRYSIEDKTTQEKSDDLDGSLAEKFCGYSQEGHSTFILDFGTGVQPAHRVKQGSL